MEYRYLGHSGLKVSELCLGTLSFGQQSSEALSHELLDRFVDAGGNFLDTSNSYNAGLSEEILGRWLAKHRRHDIIVATKVRFPSGPGPGPNEVGLSRKHILDAVEASLRRLRIDYIDLYQVHCWDAGTRLEETLRTLNRLIESGKVRYIGASNYTASQLQKAVDISQRMGWEPFVSLQPQYSLLERAIEWELLPLCHEEGLGVLPWSPLRHGWLSGKYRLDTKTPGDDSRVQSAVNQGWHEAWDMREEAHTWRVVDTVRDVAEEAGKTAAQVALNWLLRRPGVTSPIIGVRNREQLNDNLGASGWSLDADQIARLDTASARPLPYPYDFISRYCGR